MIHCSLIYGSDDPKFEKTLSDILQLEDDAAFDDDSLSAVEQIAKAQKRFYSYRDHVCRTPEDIKATRACFKRVLHRIIERAREKVREAEDFSERMIERALGKAVPT